MRGISLLVLAIACTVLSYRPVSSTSYAPTFRDITIQERIGFATGMADAIVIATLTENSSSLVRDNPKGTSKHQVKAWRFNVTRWLKGKPLRGANLKIGLNQFREFPLALGASKPGDKYLLFLQAVDHNRKLPPHARYIPADDWDFIVVGTPRSYSQGAVPLTAGNAKAELIEDVRTAISRQEPQALSQSADVIVFAKPDFDNQQECQPYDVKGGCIPFTVTEVVRGTPPETGSTFYSVIPYYHSYQRGVLLFLKKRSNQLYELLEGPAGYVPIDASGLDKTGVSYEQWRSLTQGANHSQLRSQP